MLNGFLKTALPAMALIFAGDLLAAESREITWDDLVPAEAQFDDPFTRLNEDQLFELLLVAQIRDRLDAGEEVDERNLAAYRERLAALQDEDVDVDGLLGMREAVTRQRVAKTFLANQQLDGQQVRMPGYLLPLEFDGRKVSEFLLVPYVGACIHTPPPPPNQIVHVTAEDGFELDEGLYTPVWVNGLMKTQRSDSDLSLVDGSAEIPSAYTIDASTVTPYE